MRKLEKDANADRFRKEVTYEREMRDLGWFGLIEMLLETLPQCSLQTYVGVSYGQFEESFLPIFSVAMGFLAGGATIFGFESRRRNRELPDKSHLKANSKYGVFTILGRAAQLGCLVFGTSMVACMYNASALFPGALSAVVLTYVVLESSSQKGDFSWYPQTPYNLPLSALVCLTTAYSFQHPRPAIST